MSSQTYKSFTDVVDILSKHTSSVMDKTPLTTFSSVDSVSTKEDMCDLEEAFADHLLMGKRLRKQLYAGDFGGLEELPDHPPMALTGLALEIFTKAVPNYGLDILNMDYVACVSEAARVSPCAMILAMIYLERLKSKNCDYLETVSPSGLFVVTMLVASKFLFETEDDIVTNQIWADELNFDVKDLNKLEYEFLKAIDWKVFVDMSDYLKYLSNVEKIIALKQSQKRGWFSYSDMQVITLDASFHNFCTYLIREISKIIILCTVSYVVSTLALHGTGIAIHTVRDSPQHLVSDLKLNKTDIKPIHVIVPSSVDMLNTSFKYNSQLKHNFPLRSVYCCQLSGEQIHMNTFRKTTTVIVSGDPVLNPSDNVIAYSETCLNNETYKLNVNNISVNNTLYLYSNLTPALVYK